jgi:hypothetical protein
MFHTLQFQERGFRHVDGLRCPVFAENGYAAWLNGRLEAIPLGR